MPSAALQRHTCIFGTSARLKRAKWRSKMGVSSSFAVQVNRRAQAGEIDLLPTGRLDGSTLEFPTPASNQTAFAASRFLVRFARVVGSAPTMNIMLPTISVAIPAHDEEKFLGACIQSGQDAARRAATSIEVVVALNRCTDRTRDIAERLGARCVVEDAKCIASVRNAAVRASTAPYVITVDADSRVKPGAISSGMARQKACATALSGGTESSPRAGSSICLATGTCFAIRDWFMRCCKAGIARPRTGSITTLRDEALCPLSGAMRVLSRSQGLAFTVLPRPVSSQSPVRAAPGPAPRLPLRCRRRPRSPAGGCRGRA